MQLVGIRDLKNRLTHYLETAKKGETIVVTDRGAPVAILHNLDHIEETAGPEERLAFLAKQGFVTLSRKGQGLTFPPIGRVKVKGAPVSDTIVEERR